MSNMPNFYQQIENELTGNILPFWMQYTVDHQNGGFYGALTNERQVHNQVERSAILCARILWTFSAAFQRFPCPEYIQTAQHAYQYLCNTFWDKKHHGVFWTVDQNGQPLNQRKQTYAQAFALYGLAEYYAASRDQDSLNLAKKLYRLLETHTRDPEFGGYIEARSRSWQNIQDMRLSDSEPNCPKSMNSLLHILEAYTRLYQVWPDPNLRQALKDLLGIMQEKVIDHERGAFRLFFERDWQAISDETSYGHDIEGSWLLFEAAKTLGDEPLRTHISLSAVKMAESVCQQGRDPEGAILNNHADPERHWWPQAEALVGFYNAYQISRDLHFLAASRQSWQVINQKFIDRQHGEWVKIIDQSGKPDPTHYKTGPWECPYHNARACLEMLKRLT